MTAQGVKVQIRLANNEHCMPPGAYQLCMPPLGLKAKYALPSTDYKHSRAPRGHNIYMIHGGLLHLQNC